MACNEMIENSRKRMGDNEMVVTSLKINHVGL